ncbi:radical SAM family heme chaperone HemW [Daejeonella sp. JGW-45]|uniref:radical SAM family heme chaperone HemW n=1 Tax=Daejeonella sp. JGW-45 TaxID=3034148 RepID=UPI0023EC195A|nr:radical SAM family heme chaperone HemW [Daejeonella sp. JGW-45]
MAGIYIHIPFCKKACHYCDFHFSTSPVYKDAMVQALKSEIIQKKEYTGTEQIGTIYFGGGTPSLLSADELKMLIGVITENYPVLSLAEITLEANPDDLNPQKVKELKQTMINRFSIGVQSFFEDDLKWMNRAHNASEAQSSIKRVQDAGFENITADLIYGYPLLSDEKWKFNIRELTGLQIPHISSYSMTVEPATALASFINKGKQKPMDEQQSAQQFEILIDELSGAGFEHYEISNFAKPGWHSRHNSNYWEGVSYIGIGPSAHSFNGDSRQWNIADNMKYIQGVQSGTPPSEVEHLTMENRLNEYIMTALRTSKGMNLNLVSQRFNSDYSSLLEQNLQPFLDKRWANITGRTVTLSKEGKLFADHIASELFIDSQTR